MKVLLIKPHSTSDHIQPSVGLGYLATAIRRHGQVRILDCIKQKLPSIRIGEVIKNYRPDIVGMQCYTSDLSSVKVALGIIKKVDKKIVTVVGGPHPSAKAEESMLYFNDSIDFIFKGECEKPFSDFVEQVKKKDINLHSIPGITWKDARGIHSNTAYFEEDLDSLGMPAWDLIRPENYPEAQHGAFYKKFPIAPIMLTRGCPYPCTFCAGRVISGTRLRKRSIEAVLEEIRILYQNHGIREFHIIDDNFTLDTVYAKAFLRKLISEDLDISLATPNGVRLDTLDEELLCLMKESGFYLISVGIESGSERILQLMKKGLSVCKIREKILLIRSHGINVAGFFILGFPGESRRDMLKTIDFSLDLGLLRANYFTFLPFPGTESYEKLTVSGELKNVSLRRFHFMSAAYAPGGMTRCELRQWQRLAFFRFYSRPGIFLNNFSNIKSWRHFLHLLKRFIRWAILS
ncbi:MAG TPA: hypothetical protein DCL35_07960 [Candidatus Omnitrophica bacterium]|nr:hypothetical protein [Candidatus Omnitrophota bacterium]